MATRNPDEILALEVFCEAAPQNREPPAFPLSEGYTDIYDYAISGGSALPANRKFNNYIWRIFSMLSRSVLVFGAALPWLDTVPYSDGSIATAGDPNDKKLYRAIADNTNIDPTLSPTTWEVYETANRQPQFYIDSGNDVDNILLLNPLTVLTAPNDYFDGMVVNFTPNFINTGTVQVNVNGLGNVPLVDSRLNALIFGELRSSTFYQAIYFGGVFVLLQNVEDPAVIIPLTGIGQLNGRQKGVLQADLTVINDPTNAYAAIVEVNFQNDFDDTEYYAQGTVTDATDSYCRPLLARSTQGISDGYAGIRTILDPSANGQSTLDQTLNFCQIVPYTLPGGVVNSGGTANRIPPLSAVRNNFFPSTLSVVRFYHNYTLPLIIPFMSTVLKRTRNNKGSRINGLDVIADIKSCIKTETKEYESGRKNPEGVVEIVKHISKKRVFDEKLLKDL